MGVDSQGIFSLICPLPAGARPGQEGIELWPASPVGAAVHPLLPGLRALALQISLREPGLLRGFLTLPPTQLEALST